jgi:hypothetical protein
VEENSEVGIRERQLTNFTKLGVYNASRYHRGIKVMLGSWVGVRPGYNETPLYAPKARIWLSTETNNMEIHTYQPTDTLKVHLFSPF